MNIIVCIRNVYGNELIYPVCDTAKLLAKLAGRKTLGIGDIKTIEALGYVVHVQPQKLGE